MKKVSLLIALLFCSFSLNAQLTIRYVGNMGVLISGEESSVLIDGLHTEYNKESYLFPPQSLVDSLTNSLGNFPTIKAIATTHYHGDHFDAQQVHTFLYKNNWALFFGSKQSTELVSEIDSKITNQIITIDTESYRKQSMKVGDISITGFYMDHVNPDRHGSIQNIGYIIEIDGVKILHTGDSNWFEEVFSKLELQLENIDIAIFPFWMLLNEESRQELEKWINPKEIIATHLPPSDYEDYIKAIKSIYPKAYCLTTLNQQVNIRN